MSERAYDAVVVGSGPNGLGAAISLAQAGRSVLVLEAQPTTGGGCRSAELTIPGVTHDICSAVHPLALASPFFRTLPLERYGLRWVHSPAQLAHPLDGGIAATLDRSIDVTADGLGPDAEAYRSLMKPLLDNAESLVEDMLGTFRMIRHPFAMARFGLQGIRSSTGLAESRFQGELAKGLFAGMAAHSMLRLEQSPSAAFGLIIGMLGHYVGWPVAEGGSQRIVDALSSHLTSLGGEIRTDFTVESLSDLPPTKQIFFDLTPWQVLKIAGQWLPKSYRRQLAGFRYGPGVFKLDLTLDGPVPWAAPECAHAITVHVGGTLAEIARAEREVALGKPPERPFVLVAQQSLFDPTRVPDGKQAVWAYCHVPNGSTFDMTDRIEAQIERFAPGFRDRIIARTRLSPREMQAYNANYIGGDINGGIQDIRQTFLRPVMRLSPYKTPNKRIFICSSSTPPGGGVHGMCGYHAVRAALG